MKVTISALLLYLFFTLSTCAQNPYSIKGAVADSSANSHLVNTTVCVLNAKDSTLRGFTRVNINGTFAINNLVKGNFILLITYPNYADYVDTFTLDSAKTT